MMTTCTDIPEMTTSVKEILTLLFVYLFLDAISGACQKTADKH